MFIMYLIFVFVQIYQPLDIYVVLVGPEVWTGGDMIDIILSDADLTLSNFKVYSQTYISASRDDTQLIT